MKKLLLSAGLAVSLVLASALSAFAATNLNTTTGTYEPTPGGTTFVTPDPAGTNQYAPANNAPTSFAPTDVNSNLPSGAPSTSADIGLTSGKTVTRIHSNYAANTNACAACHATHTGVGENLLQWEGETQTCMACHDGTAGVTTYNVSGGEIGTTGAITNGGVFPAAGAVDSLGAPVNSSSMHDVFGGVQVKAAPGGNFAATGTSIAADKGRFMDDFTCVSCHSPHGNGGNFRILDPNVNGFAYIHTNATATTWNVVAAPNGVAGQDFAVVAAFADVNSTAPFYAYLLTGPYPLPAPKVFVNAAQVTTGFTIDNTGGYTVIKFAAAPGGAVTVTANVAAKVKANVDSPLTANEKVTYVNGFSDFCGACHTDYNTSTTTTGRNTGLYGDRSFFKTAFAQAKDGTTPLWQDAGSQLPVYIPSHAVSVQTGTFTQAYRHTVGFSAGADGHGNAVNGMPFEQRKYFENGVASYSQNYLSCLSCHVAHGTDNAYWQAYATQRGEWGVPVAAGGTAMSANAQNIYNTSEVFDTTNASTTDPGNGNVINARGSNLKRMPNMAACEGCHGKGANAQGFNITTNNN